MNDIELLTHYINEESLLVGIEDKAEPFQFMIHNEAGTLIAGVNGSLVYGSVYTDQLWVRKDYRKKGMGRDLMEKVHQLGRSKGCTMATVSTMSFQGVVTFYESLGYTCDFERSGYSNNSRCLFLVKKLSDTTQEK